VKRRTSRNRNGHPDQLSLGLTVLGDRGVVAATPLSRATATRSKTREAPAPKPWLCAVLAVDTARQSGWAISRAGSHVDSGEVDTLDEVTVGQIVDNAIGYAAATRVPLVMVLESPFGGSVAVIAALGVARERWLRAWRACDQSLGRVVRVAPSTWRGPVLGARSVGLPRDEIRRVELATARALVGDPMIGHDEAAAILIARWASHAAAVGVAIGKRAARASLEAWTGAHGAKARQVTKRKGKRDGTP